MSLYRFASACDAPDAPAAPVSIAAGEPEQVAQLPFPRHRSRDQNFRALFDSSLIADLNRSAERGAAFDTVAPVTAASAETGAAGSGGLLVILALAFAASRLS